MEKPHQIWLYIREADWTKKPPHGIGVVLLFLLLLMADYLFNQFVLFLEIHVIFFGKVNYCVQGLVSHQLAVDFVNFVHISLVFVCLVHFNCFWHKNLQCLCIAAFLYSLIFGNGIVAVVTVFHNTLDNLFKIVCVTI